MKTVYLFVFVLILNTNSTFAQIDSTRVEQYCEMVAQGKLFSNKITIDIDFGEGRSLYYPPKLRQQI